MYTEWKINTESHSKTIKGEWRREGGVKPLHVATKTAS